MTTAPVGCLDGEQAIRDALAAGPTPGPWIAEINSIGTHVFSAAAADVYPRNIADLTIPFWAATDPDDQHGVRTRVQADTRYIAACHPKTMRALLAELDRLRSASRQEGSTANRLLIDALDRYLRQDETAADIDNGVYRQGVEAMKVALAAAPQQAQEAQGDSK